MKYDPSLLNDEQRKAVEHPLDYPAVIIAGAGSGKCLGKGTPILMYDGRVKKVEEVIEGDTLMGPDSSPRKVLSLARGRETMYRVTPVKGEPFECNESHILSLKNTTQDKSCYGIMQDVSVRGYLNWSKTKKKCFKLYRVGVDFNKTGNVGMDPYLLGLWLGDSDSNLRTFEITTRDQEIKTYVSNFCGVNNLKFQTGRTKGGTYLKNPLLERMREMGLHKNKHIPHEFKVASRINRLKLLAGLVDSDGWVHKGGCEIATKFECLAEDMAFLARSLGFACYIKKRAKICYNNGVENGYYTLSLSGDMSEVPTLLPRKKFSIRKQIKGVLHTGFSIVNIGEGDYYGFEIDGDRRFLLGDFTVTHNTHAISHRTVYLMDVAKVTPRKILVFTFTNKAANELRERICLEEGGDTPRVCTIHGLALSVIRRNPMGFGLGEKVTPIDDYNQKQILKKVIEEQNLVDEVKEWDLLEKIGYHRARGVGFRVDYTPEIHEKALEAYGGLRAVSSDELCVWAGYEKFKKRISVLDFDDMLHLVTRRGREDEKWRVQIQKAFSHILMDEVQDTNVVQFELANLLVGPDNKNLYLCGDCSQSIYGFQGASPELFYNYTKDWRGVQPTLYKLEKNHRSVPEIVALANKTQRLMTEVVPIQMKSYRGEQGETGTIILRAAGTPQEIAYSMSEDIERRHSEEGELYKETAILVRAGSQVRDIETELVRNRIPYVVRGAMGLMQTEEVKDVLSYMRIMVNPKDYFAMLRSVAIPKRGVGDAVLEKVRIRADKDFDGNLLWAAMEGNPIKFGAYLSILNTLVKSKDEPITVLNLIIKLTGYEKIIRNKYKKDKDKIEVKLANLDRLREVITNLTTMNQLSTEDVVFQLTMQDTKDEDEKEGRVTISTIHSSKGLEWPNVYLAGCYEGSIPHKFSTSPEELQEERRVFYVACTRAKNRLILCVPGMINYFNKGSVFVSPSRFLSEIGVMK